MVKPRVSIVIIVKNDPGIERTLKLVYEQATDVPFEVIVVDASKPERLAEVRQKFPNVRWEQFDQKGKRFTINPQRNRGIELARGEIIVFIDANCEPVEGWLQALLTAIDDGEAIVTGPCYPSNTHNLVSYTLVRSKQERRRYIRECPTINVALRREVIDRVGAFDTSFEFGGDVDFMWRATDAGFQICFEPSAQITHDFGDSSKQIERAYRYGKGRAMLYAKHLRRRWQQLLLHEPHVWMYPVFIALLPLALVLHLFFYLLLLVIPVIKNRSLTLALHHLIFAWGVIVGTALALR